MSAVPLPKTEPTPATSFAGALPTIKTIFAAFSGATHKMTSRASQLRLAELVRSALSTGGVCCVEAPTGTGKTLGYLAGAIEAQAHSGSKLPVVVATATVSLQDQIIRHDIPRLEAIGAIHGSKVAVAKGRGRYFCPRTCSMLEDKKMQDTQHDMFDTEKVVADAGVPIALDMLRSWSEKQWDGEKDSWIGQIPECWDSACAASGDTCVGSACEFYDRCPYMASRQRLAKADLIIANHDLVLADLAQRQENPQAGAIPVSRYQLVVDEAHHFPDKAVKTKKATANLFNVDWLRKLDEYGERVYASPKIARALSKHTTFSASTFSADAAQLIFEMDALSTKLAAELPFTISQTHSWNLGKPSDDILKRLIPLAGYSFAIHEALTAASKAYSDLAAESVGADKSFAVRQLAEAHRYSRQAKALLDGLEVFCSAEPLVRWAKLRKDGGVELHSQPIEGCAVLKKLLWDAQIPTALVSATLQINGSFERYRAKTGLPMSAVTETLPPVFDYSRGYLHQPAMSCEPGDLGYLNEVADKLRRLFKAQLSGGMLVLFTSVDNLRRTAALLPADMQEVALVQGTAALPELVAQHRAAIDSGKRSVLMGLDSMSEGLDLPGKYCTHVVVTRLPFGVPGDPVEEARREVMGRAWFNEAYLADMLTALIQSTGRLIRRETDHGVITVLDRRLANKRYGKLALSAIPSFTPVFKLKDYVEDAAARGFDLTHGQAAVKPSSAHLSLAIPVTPPLAAPAAANAETPAKPKPQPPTWSEKLAKLISKPHRMSAGAGAPSPSANACALRIVPLGQPDAATTSTAYLSGTEPCLPLSAPAHAWADMCLPQATIAGVLALNQNGLGASPWMQAMSMRPDLIAAAQVLRSHVTCAIDDRNSLMSESACRAHLIRTLSPLGLPELENALEHLETLEKSFLELVASPFKLPSKDTVGSVVDLGVALVRNPSVFPQTESHSEPLRA